MRAAYLVAGLGFGDEGKGTITDALVRRHGATVVVRYNGGAQAAHHVVLPDGRSHCFSQFGSGHLAGARTYLGPRVMIDPPALGHEAAHLEALTGANPFDRLAVHPDAPVLTTYHRLANRQRERDRGDHRHGSCGRGIGELGRQIEEAPDTVVRARDLVALPGRRRRLWRCVEWLAAEGLFHEHEVDLEEEVGLLMLWDGLELRDDVPPCEVAVFEGAQGVLLDQLHGFHPHVTRSTTTFAWAEDLVPTGAEVTRVGVTRAFATRHGAGPLPTRDEDLRALVLDGEHNAANEWQGRFRVGHLDAVLLRYAVSVLGRLDALAVTCIDRVLGLCHGVAAYQPGAGAPDEEAVELDHHGHVVGLVKGHTLAHAARLRRAVEACRPIHTGKKRPVVTWLLSQVPALASAELVLSFGPTHETKEFVAAGEAAP